MNFCKFDNEKPNYLMTEMPQIPVPAVDRFLCHGNGHVMHFSIFNCIFSSRDIPLPPRSNNIEFRV